MSKVNSEPVYLHQRTATPGRPMPVEQVEQATDAQAEEPQTDDAQSDDAQRSHDVPLRACQRGQRS